MGGQCQVVVAMVFVGLGEKGEGSYKVSCGYKVKHREQSIIVITMYNSKWVLEILGTIL